MSLLLRTDRLGASAAVRRAAFALQSRAHRARFNKSSILNEQAAASELKDLLALPWPKRRALHLRCTHDPLTAMPARMPFRRRSPASPTPPPTATPTPQGDCRVRPQH